MKKFITRAAVVILIGGMSVAIGGCYGPFRLTSHRMVGRPESDQHERRATGRSEVRL